MFRSDSSASRLTGWEVHALELTLRADLTQFTLYRSVIRRFLERHLHFPMLAQDVVMVIDEALTNVTRHSYANASDQSAQLLLSLDADRSDPHTDLTIVLTDDGQGGKGFDPKRSLTENQARRSAGVPAGFGVMLMHRVMDDVHYAAMERNRLTLRKRFCNAPAERDYIERLIHDLQDREVLPTCEGSVIEGLARENPQVEPGDLVLMLGTMLGCEQKVLRPAIAATRRDWAKQGHGPEEPEGRSHGHAGARG